ncbi:uncharacterized protein G2W53_044724 [Senna tora]|uniref:Uncharacterized protein n=1 Tax=Senna tora TaxID=362788 RepID=A0A834SC80_9FABA|nr:uncharacterized protein G2W53_044724 [Senna tora]
MDEVCGEGLTVWLGSKGEWCGFGKVQWGGAHGLVGLSDGGEGLECVAMEVGWDEEKERLEREREQLGEREGREDAEKK